MKNKSKIWLKWLAVFALFGLLPLAQAQTKIMEYNTGIAWSDSAIYLQTGLITIGTDFLAVIVNREADYQDQIIFILDLKKKVLARKFDEANRGYYWISPSGTTSSFVLNYNEGPDHYVSLWTFNKKNRNWSESTTEKVTTGNVQAASAPLLPGYFVSSVNRSGNHWLYVYKF